MPDRPLPPAVTSADLRLDAILDELRGLRADLERAPVALRQRVDQITAGLEQVADGATVELREPEPPPRPAKRARR
ncbi:MAG: hypothetical protein IT337_09360 [Thermomicrobiales bacterium]|nr:hypothetical protein [Thermomicrobiales bacterium]